MRIKYNYSSLSSPALDMVFLDEVYIKNLRAVCELILSLAKSTTGFAFLVGKDYRGKRVVIEDFESFEKLDLSSAGFHVVDGSYNEVASFDISWWNVDSCGLIYPSVRISSMALAGFDGDWACHCERLKSFIRISTPLWAGIQYFPVTNIRGQAFKIAGAAHETKIPSIGLVNYFGKAYLDGVFGGWKNVASRIDKGAKRDHGGFWVEYADFLSRNNGVSFDEYRVKTELALLDCDAWGENGKDSVPIKAKILREMGLDEKRFDSSELKAAFSSAMKAVLAIKKAGGRVSKLSVEVSTKT